MAIAVLRTTKPWLVDLVRLEINRLCLSVNKKGITPKPDNIEILEWQALRAIEKPSD